MDAGLCIIPLHDHDHSVCARHRLWHRLYQSVSHETWRHVRRPPQPRLEAEDSGFDSMEGRRAIIQHGRRQYCQNIFYHSYAAWADETQAARFPSDSFSGLKLLQGVSFGSPQAELHATLYPQLDVAESDRSTVNFKRKDGSIWSNEALVAMQLANVKHLAEAVAAENVRDAIITVSMPQQACPLPFSTYRADLFLYVIGPRLLFAIRATSCARLS